MKLLLDQGLARSTATALREVGFDALHVGDIGMAEALDAHIVERARIEGRVIVTLDADFHAILALTGATSPSVIRLRIQGLRGAEVARRSASCSGRARMTSRPELWSARDLVRIKVKRLPIGR